MKFTFLALICLATSFVLTGCKSSEEHPGQSEHPTTGQQPAGSEHPTGAEHPTGTEHPK